MVGHATEWILPSGWLSGVPSIDRGMSELCIRLELASATKVTILSLDLKRNKLCNSGVTNSNLSFVLQKRVDDLSLAVEPETLVWLREFSRGLVDPALQFGGRLFLRE